MVLISNNLLGYVCFLNLSNSSSDMNLGLLDIYIETILWIVYRLSFYLFHCAKDGDMIRQNYTYG